MEDGLQQLQALANLSPARQDVANAQATVQSANQAATTAGTAVTQAATSQQRAASELSAATHRVVQMAVASYMGESDLAPTADPGASALSGAFGGEGTQAGPSSGAYLDPAESNADADALLQVVTNQATTNLHNTQKQVAAAGQSVNQARTNQSAAQDGVTLAQDELSQAQAVLTETVAAATTPGLPVPALVAAPPPSPATTSAAPAAPASSAPASTPASTPTSPPSTPTASAPPTTAAKPTAASTTVAPTSSAPSGPAGATAVGPSILGPPTLTAAELANWFTSTGHTANTTVPIAQLAQDYITAGNATGVRGDIAFAQSVVETGYFSFPTYGQVTPANNNFAGIGACDTCATGMSFPDALTGVSAQMELLEAYATPKPIATPLVGHVGVGGCCSTWMALTGTWATNPNYGVTILTTYSQILAWAIPQRLLAAGLSGGAPSTAPAAPSGGVPGNTELQAPTLATTTTAPPPGQGPSLAPPTSAAARPGAPQVTAAPPP